MRVVPALLLSVLCASLLGLAVSPAIAAATATETEVDTAIAKAVAFAASQHDPATGEPPAHERTSFYSGEWLASGYAAAGLSAADVRIAANPSFQDFLFDGEMAGFWDEPFPIPAEYTGRLILVAHAAGIDTSRVSATQNLPARMIEALKPSAGGFGEPNTFSTAWGTLALESTPMPKWSLAPMLAYLRGDQHADGGWSFHGVGEGEPSNPDITAAALGALCGGGVPAYDPTVSTGFAYLRGLLVDETGAIEHPEFGPNVDSASFTVNALDACGVDPQSSAWTTADGKTPIDFILSLRDAEGGFEFFAGEPWFPPSTGHALRALSGRGFVVGPAPRQDPAQPPTRPVPAVAAVTPVPHVLAIELASGNVRLCRVTAPVGAPLSEVLGVARTASQPAGCVTSFSVSAGEVTEIDGVAAEGEDEAWLARLDRGAAAVAAGQPVGFGDTISLRRGPRPPDGAAGDAEGLRGQAGAAGQAGLPGKSGKRGARGRRGKPGRNAAIVCKVRHRRAGKAKVRCTVKHRGGRPAS